MRTTLAAGLLVLCCCAVPPGPDDAPARVAQELGEPVLTDAGFVFPSWEERVIYTLTNRARTDPMKQQGECVASPGNPYIKCPWDEAADGGCYTPQTPLVWDLGLSQSARFHATYLSKGGQKLGHDNCCTLRTDIATAGCDGDPACACVANTQAGTCAAGCTGATTPAATRIGRFTSGYSGEIAHQFYSDPVTIFHGWVDENLGASTCSFGGGNGHRWLIMKNGGPRIGAGHHKTPTASCNSPYWVEDFGGAAVTIPRIPGAVHYPKAGTPTTQFTFWANWYHAGGAAPSRSAVVVNGNCRSMALDFGSVQNGSYKYTGTVPTGCQPYYFLFVDSGGGRVTYPTLGSMTISSTTACANDYVATQLPADCEGAGGGAGGGGGSGGTGGGTSGTGGGGTSGTGGGGGTSGTGGGGGSGGAGGGTSGTGGGTAGTGGGTSGAGGGTSGAGGGTSGAGGGTSGTGGGTSGAGGGGTSGTGGGTSGTGGGTAGTGGGTSGAGGGNGGSGGGKATGGGNGGSGGGGATTTTGGCGCTTGGDLLFPLLAGLALVRRGAPRLRSGN